MLNVTATFFPPIEEYYEQVRRIWENQWLTNRGALIQELETSLKAHLGVSNILIMNNGTIPLQIALKNLGQKGEIITTPFSYVATTAAIVWEGCTPVFVDIDPLHLTIDETKIEAAITSKTRAILATHVFGNPCHVEAIEAIAKKHQLKVIYDAAHCFGVRYKGESIFNYGDVSTCSFHATKIFHTGEGGAVFCKEESLRSILFYNHNFGHNGPLEFHGLGINGKISELQAAMGLTNLAHIHYIMENRKRAVDYYDAVLNFNKLKKMQLRAGTQWNYHYYPILFESEAQLLTVQTELNKEGIYPRRYFYPSLNTLNYIKSVKMPHSESVASRILCLPLSHQIKENELEQVCHLIHQKLC
jgi:dTDP-4-amino-4,6-dideoxygalactose transaminase